MGKEFVCNAGRCRFDPWVGKIPWRRAWQPLQYSCLENPHEQRRESWQTAVHGVTKVSDTAELLSTAQHTHNSNLMSYRSNLGLWVTFRSLLIPTKMEKFFFFLDHLTFIRIWTNKLKTHHCKSAKLQ